MPFGRRRRPTSRGRSYQVSEVIGSAVELDDAIEAAAIHLAARQRAERASRRAADQAQAELESEYRERMGRDDPDDA